MRIILYFISLIFDPDWDVDRSNVMVGLLWGRHGSKKQWG
jgi:hypothetical protein